MQKVFRSHRGWPPSMCFLSEKMSFVAMNTKNFFWQNTEMCDKPTKVARNQEPRQLEMGLTFPSARKTRAFGWTAVATCGKDDQETCHERNCKVGIGALVQLATLSGMFRRSASLNVPRFVISRCLPSQIYVHICRICLVGSIEGFSPESEAFLPDPLYEEIHQLKTEQH